MPCLSTPATSPCTARRPAFATRRPRASAPGFTLIELMIAVAVVALLAAIGYPGYQDHVRKSRRAEAQSFLMAAAARQQQFLLDTRAYADTIPAIGVPVPAHVNAHYTLSLTVLAGPPPTYRISASPNAGQTEACGTLTIDQTGAKTAASGGCW